MKIRYVVGKLLSCIYQLIFDSRRGVVSTRPSSGSEYTDSNAYVLGLVEKHAKRSAVSVNLGVKVGAKCSGLFSLPVVSVK